MSENIEVDVGDITCFDHVPRALRTWFILHFIVDFLVGLPLFIAPHFFLNLFGWSEVDPFATRIVAAALFGIGGISFISRDEQVDTYKALVNLKLLWSISAEIGILISIFANILTYPPFIWVFFGVLLIFTLVWGYWWNVLKNYQ